MPSFYGTTQIHDRKRGYLRVAIPPHIIDEMGLVAGDKLFIAVEKQE